MNIKKFIELAKEAEQIAEGVSDAYRPVLFGKALEELIAEQFSGRKNAVIRKSESLSESAPVKTGDRIQKLTSIFSSHLHLGADQQILEKGSTLELSLLVMEVGDREFGLSELMPPEIAKILSQNLGIAASPNAVSMALKGKKVINVYVTRRSEGKGFAYSLTPAGREYLKKWLEKSKGGTGEVS